MQSDEAVACQEQKLELKKRTATPKYDTLVTAHCIFNFHFSFRRDVKMNYTVREKTSISSIHQDSVYVLFMSLVEVFNNSLFDLLQDQLDPHKWGYSTKANFIFLFTLIFLVTYKQPLHLREVGRRVFVHGACEFEIKSADEALKVHFEGKRRQRVAETP